MLHFPVLSSSSHFFLFLATFGGSLLSEKMYWTFTLAAEKKPEQREKLGNSRYNYYYTRENNDFANQLTNTVFSLEVFPPSFSMYTSMFSARFCSFSYLCLLSFFFSGLCFFSASGFSRSFLYLPLFFFFLFFWGSMSSSFLLDFHKVFLSLSSSCRQQPTPLGTGCSSSCQTRLFVALKIPFFGTLRVLHPPLFWVGIFPSESLMMLSTWETDRESLFFLFYFFCLDEQD